MTYVDAYMCAVPTAKKDEYRKFAEDTAVVFKEHGALKLVECWGDDVPEGKINSMHTAVLREPDETVVFSWVTWPSKAARDEAWPKIMEDPRMPEDMKSAPFDGKRMIYGGFEIILEA